MGLGLSATDEEVKSPGKYWEKYIQSTHPLKYFFVKIFNRVASTTELQQ